MIESWRWFGPEDPITLARIAQTGASGIVTSLYHLPTGSPWPLDEILERKRAIESYGLVWNVVESLPVHNDIKAGFEDAAELVENYKSSIRMLAEAGIHTICYNFMPVLDWTRTDLNFGLASGARTLRFDMAEFAAYDIYVLKRSSADSDYSPDILEKAAAIHARMDDDATRKLEQNIIAGLPGGEGSYDRAGIRQAIERFSDLGEGGLRQNLLSFLREVVPVAEEVGARLCIHPDDPPFSLLGLPRVLSTVDDVRALLAAVPSEANGVTFCAGSFGSRRDNDLVAMAREFGPHIHFVHLRNIRKETDGSFFESGHLDGDNDVVGLVACLLDEESRRRQSGRPDSEIPMRPDHGHLLADEAGDPDVNPGYSFAGRLKGLAELRGVIAALDVRQMDHAS